MGMQPERKDLEHLDPRALCQRLQPAQHQRSVQQHNRRDDTSGSGQVCMEATAEQETEGRGGRSLHRWVLVRSVFIFLTRGRRA